ncbi:MAG: hypothetical protein BEN19_03500 [Epulopiscium sp. Nuni2H_MBin003]|nr:MAG: hypothetical protein BEN19_03500 [Epulopiscium sp. Nuni2H_MBin003]
MYITIDAEFYKNGNIRELSILLFKHGLILKVLEIYISTSGEKEVIYNPQQINYHLQNAQSLKLLIDAFLEPIPIKEIKIVGMSLDHDISSINKTINGVTQLNQIVQKTQLEICGRGTLEVKATNLNITNYQIKKVISQIARENIRHYKYHTSLFDAVATGYVYQKIVGNEQPLKLHTDLKKANHTYYGNYYNDIKEQKLQSKAVPAPEVDTLPKNFKEIRFRVQKNLSDTFDILMRDIFYDQYKKLRYEPSIKKITAIKSQIIQEVYPIKKSIQPYDTVTKITDPYNKSLLYAAQMLVNKKITVEVFVDYAIYIQQYNLPADMGTYFRVTNQTKEIYVRCLEENTAKKMITKLPYSTIWQFVNKPLPKCNVDIVKN